MRRFDIVRIADPFAEQQATNKARDARVDMDHGAAGEIERPHFIEKAGIVQNRVEVRLCGLLGGIVGGVGQGFRGIADRVRTRPVPNAMRDGKINEGHPKQDEDKDGRKLHAFGEGTNDQGRGDDGERHLKHHIGIFGNDDAVGKGRHVRIRGNPFEKGPVKTADEIVPLIAFEKAEPGMVASGEGNQLMAAFGKGERIAIKAPNDRNHCHDREHLRKYGRHVF